MGLGVSTQKVERKKISKKGSVRNAVMNATNLTCAAIGASVDPGSQKLASSTINKPSKKPTTSSNGQC